ncbi:DUF5827 family protein [Halorubrum sp. Boch-26]|uniref:DUF5827 family protein n=1 Tax=Halorubrum sp. Boch-26 TaxID=2994426 RepID=UPI002468CCA4|nr:DUF5827 family protein [Halorubrum sp. Boch-26]
MPEPKSTFDATYPCEFYEPAELFEPDLMYTVPEIARLLQGLEPDAQVDPDTEAVLIDWAIPWVMTHAEDIVIAEPLEEDGPGYYGVAEHAVDGGDTDDDGEGSAEGEDDADGDDPDA